jgi:Mrp family chromosome partitioning ATPase
MTTTHAKGSLPTDRAERLRRLRATACSTVVQRDEPQTPCAGEPVLAARLESGEFILVDMAHPASKPPKVVARPQVAAAPASVPAPAPATAPPAGPTSKPTAPPAAPPVGVPIYRLDAPQSMPPRPALIKAAERQAEATPPPLPAELPRLFPISEACRSLCGRLKSQLSQNAASVAWVRLDGGGEAAEALVEVAQGMLAGGAKQVLLVDADFSQGRVSRMFDLASASGLAESMTQPGEARRAVRATGLHGLSVLPRGEARGNAVRSDRESWQRVLGDLRKAHDFILIDAPDAAGSQLSAVCGAADAACVAVTLAHTPRQQALDVVGRLLGESIPVAGCVLI